MKTNRIFLYAAALMMAVACGKEAPVEPVIPDEDTNDEVEVTPQPEYAVSFTAYTEDAPDSKATIGTNSNSRPQTFWENGDVISVYSSANMNTSSRSSYMFSTQLEENSTSAVFGYDGEDFEPSNVYFAIYPHTEEKRAVNFSDKRMAQVEIPTVQTLVAGSFDRDAMVMVAYTEDPSELHFKNAVALVKFRVADANILSGTIEADDPLSGVFRGDLDESNEPVMTVYNQPKSNFVNFSSAEPLVVGQDYYVAVRPTTLANGFHVSLNGILVKSYPSVAAFERNTIYDLGTLAIPSDAENVLQLIFDFKDAAKMSEWPTSNKLEQYEATDQINVTYSLNGVDYEFVLSNPLNASENFPYFNSRATPTRLAITNYRYVGLPMVAGYKLSAVQMVCAVVGTGCGISSALGNGSAAPTFISGGEVAAKTNFNLNGTAADTQCWIWCKGDYGVEILTLTYTQVTE